MTGKKDGKDFKVGALEGLWWGGGPGDDAEQRKAWRWKLLMRVPEFVRAADVKRAAAALAARGRDGAGVALETFAQGRVVQVLHTGPYADEPATSARLEAFATEAGLAFTAPRYLPLGPDPHGAARCPHSILATRCGRRRAERLALRAPHGCSAAGALALVAPVPRGTHCGPRQSFTATSHWHDAPRLPMTTHRSSPERSRQTVAGSSVPVLPRRNHGLHPASVLQAFRWRIRARRASPRSASRRTVSSPTSAASSSPARPRPATPAPTARSAAASSFTRRATWRRTPGRDRPRRGRSRSPDQSRHALSEGRGAPRLRDEPEPAQFPEDRKPGSDKWERVSWDFALDRIARLMKDDRDKNFVLEERRRRDGEPVAHGGLPRGERNDQRDGLPHGQGAPRLGGVAFDNQARV